MQCPTSIVKVLWANGMKRNAISLYPNWHHVALRSHTKDVPMAKSMWIMKWLIDCKIFLIRKNFYQKLFVVHELRSNFFFFFFLSTNVQRIVSGVMNMTGKNDEATFTVKYTGLPVNYDTTMHVLDTDYDSFAVIWSCNPLAGPVGHTGMQSSYLHHLRANLFPLILQSLCGF